MHCMDRKFIITGLMLIILLVTCACAKVTDVKQESDNFITTVKDEITTSSINNEQSKHSAENYNSSTNITDSLDKSDTNREKAQNENNNFKIGGNVFGLEIGSGDTDVFSRSNINALKESPTFGLSIDDAKYVAVDFAYTDNSIKNEFGDSFELGSNDVAYGPQETESTLGLYTMTAEYTLRVKNKYLVVCLEKSSFHKWQITSTRLENDSCYDFELNR